jgi:Ras-related protein Rab-22
LAIVGNKEDLAEREEVDMMEAKKFAESIGAIYRKTSAKTKFGVEATFLELAARVNPLSTVIKGSTHKKL